VFVPSGVTAPAAGPEPPPALLTRISTCPCGGAGRRRGSRLLSPNDTTASCFYCGVTCHAIAAAATFSTSLYSPETSSASPSASIVWLALSCFAAASAVSCVREVTTTLQPADARDVAISKPKCREPPVINATLPSRRNGFGDASAAACDTTGARDWPAI
jgi:hypothetical protein